ncbi:MAG TPA: hypothetical protein VHM90_07925, partial [Phycisphaerae bacterium]|nr:hypothetical protein [Phycisphaerae bacterium]
MNRRTTSRIARSKRAFLALEKLESRIQLSSVAGAAPSIYPHAIDVHLKNGQMGTAFIDALQKTHFCTPLTDEHLEDPLQPTPDPSPDPSPDPAPTPDPDPTPTPDPAPTPDPDPTPTPDPDPLPPPPPPP